MGLLDLFHRKSEPDIEVVRVPDRKEVFLRLKTTPHIDFARGAVFGSKYTLSGYTIDGNGELIAMRLKTESGVDIEIAPMAHSYAVNIREGGGGFFLE